MDSQIGPYQLLHKLGHEESGVWVAGAGGDRRVVVKTFSGMDVPREFRILLELDHPGIPRPTDCGVFEGRFWFASDWREGSTLRDGLPPQTDVSKFAAGVVQTLLYLDACRLWHGDVSPNNLLAARDGFPSLLLDFGTAGARGRGRPGTAACQAPELLRRGVRTLATDLFALGASLQSLKRPLPIRVQALVESLLAEDPGARVEAARQFVGEELPPESSPRLAGREAEIARLTARLDPADARGVKSALVVGEPGLGKTRLLRHVEMAARARGWFVGRHPIGMPATIALSVSAQERPYLAVLDDVDLATSVVAIEAIRRLRAASENGIFVLAGAAARVPWPDEVVELPPLHDGDVAAVVRQSASPFSLDAAAMRDAVASAGGNPAAAQRAGRAWAIVSRLGPQPGMAPAGAGIGLAVPANAAILAKMELDGLPAPAVRLLAAAAMARGSFDVESLCAAAEVPPDTAAGLLERNLMVNREGLWPRNAALGVAALAALPADRKADLRRRLAAIGLYARRPAAEIAEHLLEAGDRVHGPALALRASRDASTPPLVVRRLLARAAELADSGHPDAPWIEQRLLADEGRSRPSEAVAERAERAARATQDPAAREALLQVALSQWARLRRWDEAERLLEARGSPQAWAGARRALLRVTRSLIEGTVDPKTVPIRPPAECRSSSEAQLVAWVLSSRGELRAAARALLRAARLAREEVFWRSWAAAVGDLCCVLSDLGRHRTASGILDRAQREIESWGVAAECIRIYAARPAVEAAAGQLSRAKVSQARWEKVAILADAPADVRARYEPARATIRRHAGDAEGALDSAERAVRELPPSQAAYAQPVRILALCDLGRFREAAATAAEFRREREVAGDPPGAALAAALHASVKLDAEEFEEFRELATRIPDAELPPYEAAIVEAVRAEEALYSGRTKEALALAERVAVLALGHRLFAGEFFYRLVAHIAREGERAAAGDLLRSFEEPESTPIRIWACVARARCHTVAMKCRRELDTMRSWLEDAGLAARREYAAAQVEVARRERQLDVEKVWDLRLKNERATARQEQLPEEPRMQSRDLSAAARRIRDIVKDVNSELAVGGVLARIMDAAISLSGAERGCIVLVERDDSRIRLSRPEGAFENHPFSRSVSDQVLRSGNVFHSPDALSDNRLSGARSLRHFKIHSVLCLPFRVKNRTIGTFYLDHRTKPGVFDPEILDALETLCELAGVAIENARVFEEMEALKNAQMEKAERLQKSLEAERKQRVLREESELRFGYPEIVGRSPAMLRMLKHMEKALDQDFPVLIEGETGTGKELVAKALHAYGRRSKGPFVAQNCAAISPQLVESELFGHVKGAFTGATADHEGLFRRAHKGTLLLDEIGDLDSALQAKLLRVLEDGVVRPVGADEEHKVRVRVIAATHRDLRALVEDGRFRADLYHRLASFRISVPPLSERPEDIPALVAHFLEGTEATSVSPEGLRMLMGARWHGNVRQLKQRMEVLGAAARGQISAELVAEALSDLRPGKLGVGRLQAAVLGMRKEQIREALLQSGGSIMKAAKRLGISYQGLWKLVRRYDLAAFARLRRRT